jgi:hypothetical protein
MSHLQSNIQACFQFENEFIPKDFIDMDDSTNLNLNLNFGVLHLKINKTDPIIKKRHIVFSVDCSGSMSDITDDGRTKMDHSNHTLINMIIYFANHPELLVSISVFAFDGSIYTIIENKEITQDNLDYLIKEVKNIRPKDTTDIEKAIINSNDYISKYISDINNEFDVDIVHIFMTDGDATQGKQKPSELKELVTPLVTTIFIGFGVDHNSRLLKELSSDGNNGYYFVDALEKSGLVYGEILHAYIYKLFENTCISVTNGMLYDWKKNIWVDKLNIGYLIGETNKTIHILSSNPTAFTCTIESKDCASKILLNLPVENNIVDGFIDLSKYKYRQRTQQLLFEVNRYNFDNTNYENNCENFWKKQKETKKILKKKMTSLLEEMKQLLEKVVQKDANQLLEKVVQKEDEERAFIKMLCDDIYVCLKTFDTKYGAMYSCARQISQGSQRSYSANYTPSQNNNINFNATSTSTSTPMFIRSCAYKNTLNDYEEECVFRPMFPEIEETQHDEPFVHLSLKKPSSDSNLLDCEENVTRFRDYDSEFNTEENDDYKVSEQIDNPYISNSILEMMRTCSASVDEYK